MELSELQPNALVEHQSLGIGRIAGREADQVIVAFRSNPNQRLSVSAVLRSFAALPEGGLATYCYEKGPEEVRSWVMDGPLRLVGATLFDLGGSGKSGPLKSRLKAIVSPEVGWDSWWDNVRPAVKNSSHFEVAKSNVVKLLSSVEDIPIEPLPRKESEVSEGPSRKQSAPARRLAEELQSVRESHSAYLKQLREEHTEDLRRLRESHAADLQQQRAQHNADLIQQREAHTADAEQQRKEHAAGFKQWQGEEDRLNYQIKSLWASIDSRMEQSRLAARKDMLLRIGDILQRAYHPTNDPETRLNQVIAHLPLALGDGGAELLGEVGEIVSFDPSRHHPSQEIASGSLVRLTAPGVIISGGEAGDMVILKANATPITEEN